MANPFGSVASTVVPKGSFRRVEGAGVEDASKEAMIDRRSLELELGQGWDRALKKAYEESGLPIEETEESKVLKALASVLGEDQMKELLAKVGANPDLIIPGGEPRPDQRSLGEIVEGLVQTSAPVVRPPEVDLKKKKTRLQEEIGGIRDELQALGGIVYKAATQEEARKRSIQVRQDKLSALEAEYTNLLTNWGLDENEVCPEQLKMGIEIEKEHTQDEEVAKRIALDHLHEIPDYYTKLKKMEKESANEDQGITLEDLEAGKGGGSQPPPEAGPPNEGAITPPPSPMPVEGEVVSDSNVEVPIDQVIQATREMTCPNCNQRAGLTMDEEGRLQLSCPACDWEEPVSAEVLIQVGSGTAAEEPEITNNEGLAAEQGQAFYQPGPTGLPEQQREEKQAMRKKAAPSLDGHMQGYQGDTPSLGTGEEPMAPNVPRPSDRIQYTKEPGSPGKGSLPEMTEGEQSQPGVGHRDTMVSTSPPPSGRAGGIKGGPQDTGSLAKPPGGPENAAGSFLGGLPDALGSPMKVEVKLASVQGPDPEWQIWAGGDLLYHVSASQAYGPLVDQPYTDLRGREDPQGRTHLEVFKSAEYGRGLQALVANRAWGRLKGVGGLLTKQAAPFMQPYAEDMENPSPETQPPPPRKEEEGEGEGRKKEKGKKEKEDDEEGKMNPDEDLGELMGEEDEDKMLITDILIDTIAPMIVSDSYTINEVVDELKETFSDDDLASEFSGALEEKVDSLKEEISSEQGEAEEAEAPEEGEMEGPGLEMAPPEATPALREERTASKEIFRLKQQLKQARLEKQAAEEEANLWAKVRVAHNMVRKLQERGRLKTTASFEAEGMDHNAAVQAEQEMVKAEIERIVRLAGNDFDQLVGFIDEITEPPVLEVASSEGEEKVAADQGLKLALASIGHQPIVEPTPPQRSNVPGVLGMLDETFWTRSKGVTALKGREPES